MALFDKNLVPNLVAIVLIVLGMLIPPPVGQFVFYTGLFALSGAVTNWLAVHMLFEKVPGLYGSGVIPLHFDEFKTGIQKLVTQELFNRDSVERFFQNNEENKTVDLEPVIKNLDMDDAFDQLVSVVMDSELE